MSSSEHQPLRHSTDGMVLFVKAPDDSQTLCLEVHPSDTVYMVKRQVEDRTGLRLEPSRRPIFAGRCLDDHQTLESVGVQHEDTFSHWTFPPPSWCSLFGCSVL
eukprot:gnl/Spiro4/14737_TR7938_c0_g1_i1.p1 gnl/Spiro4/14737_TR7938_c0_g1~~gnl/Spiro4/14737_TR7938_c0_g1_i1.p1  ORF type:complete len:104 (+),score=11.16 gnl/Spiro4/14737_TR7938_c0_g1_i1:60-371(+)